MFNRTLHQFSKSRKQDRVLLPSATADYVPFRVQRHSDEKAAR